MIRKAKIKDIKQIQKLINFFAAEGLMLPRSINEIYENIRDFWVYVEERRILGCLALHISWEDLAEIKSLAVEKSYHNKGIGYQLVNISIKEAKELGAGKIFVLTYLPNYFKKFGFSRISHKQLPHKIWADCINCPRFPDCKETALIKKI